MHIAVIRRKYTATGGGAEKYTLRMVQGLLERGHEVTVLSEQFTEQEFPNLHWLKVPKSLLATSKTAAFHKSVQNILKQNHFDVVYGLCRTFPTDVLRVTEQLHIEWHPMAYPHWSKYLPRHRSILELERAALRPENTTYVITNSALVKKQIVDHYGFPAERIKVIYNGIEPAVFYPATTQERRRLREELKILTADKVILFVAANFKIKGLESAIRVLANIRKQKVNATLIVIGGDDPAPYQKIATELAVQEYVVFKGNQQGMRDYYAAADVLLYPSLYEPFGNVCLESFACGTPVITTQRNGSHEIIEHGVNGFTVETAEDIEAMTEYTKRICDFSSLEQEAFSSSALQKSQDFRWNTHIDTVETLFKSIAKG